MDVKKKVISGLRWRAATHFLSQLITWGITILVMRILTPADYGLVAIANLMVEFVGLMADVGLGPAIVQSTRIEREDVRKIVGLSIVVNLLLYLCLYLLAPFISAFYGEPRLTHIIQIVGAQLILMALSIVPQSLLTKNMNFEKLSLIELSGNVLSGFTCLALAFSGVGVWSLVWGSMLNVVIRTIAVNVVAPSFHFPRFSLAGTRKYLVYGGHVTAARILSFLYSQADVFIAGKFLGSQLLGFYSIAMNLATMPSQKISGIINQVAFSAFAHIQKDRELVASHFLKAVKVLSLIAFPALWGLSGVAPVFIPVVLGPQWGPAIFPLQVVSLVMPFCIINFLISPLVQGIGRPEISLRNVLWASLVMPPAFLIGVQWGLAGLSVAWVTAFPLVFWGNISRTLPAIGLRPSMMLKELVWPVVSSALMYGVVTSLKVFLPFGPGGLGTLLIMIAGGAGSYIVSIHLFRPHLLKEAWFLVRGAHG